MSIEKNNDSVETSDVNYSEEKKLTVKNVDAVQGSPDPKQNAAIKNRGQEESNLVTQDQSGNSQPKVDGDSADTLSTAPKERRNVRQQRGRGNQRFNKTKGSRNKGHWQKKKKIIRDEVSPIDLGNLPSDESIATISQIEDLAEGLKVDVNKDALDFNRIYDFSITELREEVDSLEIEISNAPNRDQLINALISEAVNKNSAIITTGVLDILEDGEGALLVYQRDSYRTTALCAYVPQAFIDHLGLLAGHIVKAQLHPHREGESCPFVVKVISVMSLDPEKLREIIPFTEGVPYYPTERILMETSSDSEWDNLSMRVVDCITPVGFGQRGLIVAPPRTGKTVLLQGIANAIQMNYPKAHLIILLIDERPEEVTDFRRQVHGEVISSTFDESAESHVHAAEMVIEKARRMVEVGQDVVILLDSITRLARAYNTMMPSSGKILSGGVEANALQKPKRFFGSARNIEGSGSLTILGTALVETGSKMDEVIFEEFKGTGNMELHLDRGLSDKRIFPALSMDKSGTRKEELLYHPDEMLKIYSLRRAMKGLPSTDAMEMLIQRIKKTTTNAEFLMSVSR
ncbi:MAG: transcription termination factor Rho [Puniceicoccaceae bacterium]|nr:transcription termination factor Rho [Puniceicoccaceae bacterium]